MGISVGGVDKSTDHVIIALLSFHDKVVHFPDDMEKESSKSYAEEALCLEWHGGFLLADGSKFPFFQWPGLYSDAWFNKGGTYFIDCQVYFVYGLCDLESHNKYSLLLPLTT